jgi:DeoR family fructose operon transcriptional repressor
MTGPEDRRREIVELVTESDGLSVEELSAQLGVSESTIRRDLRRLSDRDQIERTHGGALPVTNVGTERTFDQKVVQNLSAKQAIGRRAAEEVNAGQFVFFDSGTTTLQIARETPNDGSFVSITNSPVLCIELGKEDGRVNVTGGSFREESMGLVGPTTDRYIRSCNFDLAFIGTNGLDENGAFTAPVEEGVSLKQEVIENSARSIVVANAGKAGVQRFREFATLGDIDAIITDAAVPDEFEDRVEELDTTWITVQVDSS